MQETIIESRNLIDHEMTLENSAEKSAEFFDFRNRSIYTTI